MRLFLTDLGASLSLLSRLPVTVNHDLVGQRSAKAAWAWPLAGLVVACFAAAPGLLLAALGVSSSLSAGASLATLIMVTGALHEDGLADSADGLWGGWDPSRRLEIMKDSSAGVFGVVAVVLSLGFRWLALSALLDAGALAFWSGLAASAALSRAAMATAMHRLPPVRIDGLSASVGTVPTGTAWAAVAMGLAISLVAGPSAALAAVISAAIAAIAVMRLAKAKIGGQTGDILGATQQVSEIAAIIAVSAVLA